jgi:hypothetical protein
VKHLSRIEGTHFYTCWQYRRCSQTMIAILRLVIVAIAEPAHQAEAPLHHRGMRPWTRLPFAIDQAIALSRTEYTTKQFLALIDREHATIPGMN